MKIVGVPHQFQPGRTYQGYLMAIPDRALGGDYLATPGVAATAPH